MRHHWGGVVLMGKQTRSAESAGASLELWPDAPTPGPAGGVGGRHAPPAAPRGGGGYLDGRTAAELPGLGRPLAESLADPLLRELAEIGLSSMWLQVAAWLGYERFMGLWRHLSADSRVLTDDGQIVMELRAFAWYERFQCDLLIRRLAAAGLPRAVISATVREHLGEARSRDAISSITSDRWAESRMAARGAAQLSPYLVERIHDAAHSADAAELFPDSLEQALLANACLAAPAPKRQAGRDPRIAELIDIGLSQVWIDVAHLVGYDDFVALWRWWSADPALRGSRNRIELRLRTVRSFEKYQRNRYIETLVAAGLKPSQIYTMLQTHLGEKLSYRHLKRLTTAAKVRP